MKKYADMLFRSMISHDPSILPLADTYAATENGRPAALPMMTCWRTITGLNCINQLIIDKKEQQLVVTANVDEGGTPSVFAGRLKIENDKISELELFLVRSRGEAGFWYAPQDMDTQPFGWGKTIPDGEKATREELYELGRAIFDPSAPKQYESAPDCFLMELGGVVKEHIDYVFAINPWLDKSMFSEIRNPIPFGVPPTRPADPNARVVAIDEDQGIVVVIGVVDGIVSPYIVSDEISSCFVPDSMVEMHRKTLTPELLKGKSVIKEMKATGITLSIHRFFSGKLQGYHQHVFVTGYGARSVWPVK